MNTAKDKLYEIINEINEYEAIEILDFAEFVKARKRKALFQALDNAPIDDEPLTDDEEKALKKAKESLKKGETTDYNNF